MKKSRKKKTAPSPELPPEQEQSNEQQPKKQSFLKRLLFGEETPDFSELEAGCAIQRYGEGKKQIFGKIIAKG